MHVRPYDDRDLESVRRLAPRLAEGVAPWRDPARVTAAVRDWVEESLRDPERAVYVAEADGTVVGLVTVGVRRHFTGELDAYVGELAVDATVARRGVGRALMAAAEGWAAERGLVRLTLETGAANAAARAFYGALGYLEEDVRLTRAVLP